MNTKAVASKLAAEALKNLAALGDSDAGKKAKAITELEGALAGIVAAELRAAVPAAATVVERLLATKPDESKHKGVKISLELFDELCSHVRSVVNRNVELEAIAASHVVSATLEHTTDTLAGFPLKLANEGDGVIRIEDVRCTLEAVKAFFNPPTPQLLIVKRNGDTLELTRLYDAAERALNLCYAIEKLPASEQQTAISLMASDLHTLLAPSHAPAPATV